MVTKHTIPIIFKANDDQLKVGRADKTATPDIDLGKDSGCSRESGMVKLDNSKIVYTHLS